MTLSESEIYTRLQKLSADEFEHFIAELWEKRGWNTSVTAKSNDEGIDIVATRKEPFQEKELIQAKRYQETNHVGSPELQQYGNLLHRGDVDKVIVVTTSGFTDNALAEAKKSNVKPVNGRNLVQIIKNVEALDLVQKYTGDIEPDDSVRSSSSNRKPTNRAEGAENKNEQKSIFHTAFNLLAQNYKEGYDDGYNNDKSSDKVDKKTGIRNNNLGQGEDSRGGEERTTLLDDGDLLTVELVGLERIETGTSGHSLFRGDDSFEGLLVACKFFNRSDDILLVEELDEFELTDHRGVTYSATNLGKGSFGEWKKHGGRLGRVDDGYIYAGDTVKYAVGFNLPESSKPSTITLNRYEIEFEFDHKLRNELPDLPTSLKSNL
jgi:hypothetical protein